jgi:hypothetical protein
MAAPAGATGERKARLLALHGFSQDAQVMPPPAQLEKILLHAVS